MKKVRVADFTGNTLGFNGMSVFKFNIKYGECKCWFRKRIPFVDEPTVKCTYCDTMNVLPLEPA